MDAVGHVTIAIDVTVESGLRHQVANEAITIEVKGQATFVETVGVVTIIIGIQPHQHFCHQVDLVTITIQVHTTGDVARTLGGQGQGADAGFAMAGADGAGEVQVFAGDQLQPGTGGERCVQEGQCAAGFQNQGIGAQGAGQAFGHRAFAHRAV